MSAKRELFSAVVSTGLGLGTAVGSPAHAARPPAGPTESGAKALSRLGHMLDKLGYIVEPCINERGDIVGYHVTANFDDKRQEFSFDLGKDGTSLSLSTAVQRLSDKLKMPPAALARLLEANGKIRPAYFTYDERTRQIMLRLATFELAQNPDELRKQVDDFCATVRRTADVWDLSGKTDTVIMQ